MFPSRFPALLEELSRRLDSGWPEGGLLPSVRSLSKEMESSPVTVLRCLSELKRQGALVKIGGNGRYAVPGSESHVLAQEKAPPRLPRHRQIADELQSELLAGAYSGHEGLPAIKVLVTRFGCSQATMTRALEALKAAGMLDYTGRYYRRRQRKTTAGSQVYLAGFPSIVDKFHSRSLELIGALERGIQERGWGRLRLFLPESLDTVQPPPSHTVAGYIFVETVPGAWRNFFLTQRTVPIVIVDPSERLARIRLHPRYYRIQADNRFAGAECGRFLTAKGHGHVAFITHHPIETGWSANRLEGLREIWPQTAATAKRSLEVVDFSGSPATSVPDIQQAQRLLNTLRGSLNRAPQFQGVPKGGFAEGLSEWIGLYSLSERAEPHLDRVIRRKRITAWVCINDALAAVAQDFLDRKGMTPNERPVILGFDNSPLSYKLGLSSYDFSFAGMGHSALSLLEGPDRLRKLPGNIHKVRGQVIPRDSTEGV